MEAESWDLICLVSSLITLSVSAACVCANLRHFSVTGRTNTAVYLSVHGQTQRMTNERGTLINREGTHLSRNPNKLEEIAP